MARPKVIVGTSGWQYKDWNGVFYPSEIKGKAQLSYYADHFPSVEVNTTFYHMPRSTSVENWAQSVPEDFHFVIKMNRFLTHTKRLTSDDQFTERLADFLELLAPLGHKLSALLIQLPPSMEVSLSRLEYLAEQLRDAEARLKLPFRAAMEFRHASWFTEEVFTLLRRYNMANVINDSPNRWPASREVTADFAYLRLHGSKWLYRSSYTDKELQAWAHFIAEKCAGCKDVFCYFDNDYKGVAIENARRFQQHLSQAGL